MSTPPLPLSPSQKGMLFETLASRCPGIHIEQPILALHGEVDAGVFEAAWRHVMKHHAALRTAFVWRDVDEPRREISDDPPIELTTADWTALPRPEQRAQLQRALDAGRLRDFDLSLAPLMRLGLYRTGSHSWQAVWTHHHILLDGWCVPLIVRDVLAAYDAIACGAAPTLAPAPSYNDYLRWLDGRDARRAEEYWRAALRNIAAPTPLGNAATDLSDARGHAERSLLLSRDTTRQLRRLACGLRIPLGVLFHGIWALLLSRYSGERHVMFGATVSGRPAELSGVESMIGLFINTVAVAVEVAPSMALGTWLRRLHDAQSEREPFDTWATGQVHDWSAIPRTQPLFDSILVFENFPLDAAALRSEHFTIEMASSRTVGASTRFALTLLVEPGDEIAVTAVYDRARLGAGDAGGILEDILIAAESFVATPDAEVGALLAAMRHRPIPTVRGAKSAVREIRAPQTPTEAVVAAVWSEVMGEERISVDADFFDAGGHSLLATRAVSRLRETFTLDVPLRALFEHPTVEAIGRWIDSERRTRRGTPVPPPIVPLAQRDAMPASFSQERLWFLQQLDPDGTAYNAQGALALRGALDLAVLQASLDEIVRRHESLRTSFALDGAALRQIVHPPFAFSLRTVDLGDASIDDLAAEEQLRPFDLSRPPLLRALLVKSGAEENVLILTIHHIVTDGWSNSVFLHELSALYDAFRNGAPAALPPLAIQYGDFAAWQREWLRGEVLDGLLEHWKRALDGAPPLLALPAARPRPARRSRRGAMQAIEVPQGVAVALSALARAEGATLFMVLLAAFELLLHRWSGADDLVIGAPIANRVMPGTEELIGFFVNTLVLRTSLHGRPSFRELLRRVRETALDAYAHQDLPFEKLVEELRPARDASYDPLTQVFFNMLNLPPAVARLGELDVQPFPLRDLAARFDITLYAIERGDAIRFELLYDTSLFDDATMAVLLEQLSLLLAQIAARPERDIASYSLVRPRDHALLPDPAAPLPARPCGLIHERFIEQAARMPESIVIDDGARRWTYGEIDALSDDFARSLGDAGAGDVVALIGTSSAALVWSLLGVLKRGAAFLLLDAAYPSQRLERCLELARPRVVMRDGLSIRPGKRRAEGLAYVAFTSGSTGEPLGIEGTHPPISHFIAWQTETFGLGHGDRFALLSGVSHDPLLRDVFTPLSIGATLCIPTPGVRESETRLAAWMRANAITVAHLTPALGDVLSAGGEEVASLRWIFSGGDALRGANVARLCRRAPNCRVVNFYGATETPQAMAFHIARGDEDPMPLGHGIDGVQLLLRSPNGEPAGVGEVAEIFIRTPYLARGYLDNAGPDRFDGDVYRTGDLGRYLDDGTVVFAGRNDGQINLRGFRIEPREIEAALEAQPSVRQAAVIETNETLVAFVTGDAEIGKLAERLPQFMLPARIVAVDSIPLTRNGKIDRRALAAMAPAADGGAEYIAPSNPVEAAIAGMWEEVLGVPRASVTDDFFALGGHSLKATRVVARIERDLGARIALRDFFQRPIIRELAARVRGAAPRRRAAIAPLPLAATYPVSAAQRRLWMLWHLDEGSPAYNMPRALLLRGELEADALEAAMRDVVRRHEALRTTFVLAGGEVRQRIDAEPRFALQRVDLSGCTEPLARAAELAHDDARRPFHLEEGPLIRASLLHIDAQRHVLLCNIHHIVADSWSLDVIIREFGELYAARRRGEIALLPPLRIQGKDYAAWQQAALETEEAKAHRHYWRETLGPPLPVLDLPADRPRPPVMTGGGRRIDFTIDTTETEALIALAHSEGASLYMFLVASVKVLLYRYSGARDLIVGAAAAGRDDPELENQVGFYVNMLPLRDVIGPEMPFAELLRRVSHTAAEAYEHQAYPFDRLIADLGVARDPSRSPLFDAVVVLQNAERSELRLAGLEVLPFPRQSGTSKFDVNFTFEENGGRLDALLEVSSDLFDEERAAGMVSHFRELLRAIVAEPRTPVAKLNILPETERQRLLQELNDTDARYPAEATIIDLFETQAEATPEAEAVICEDHRLNYRQLNARAEALANALRGRVAPGGFIGVVLGRSEWIIVAMLAVLKAGAAYVPVDPTYPVDRIRFILDDCASALVITEEAHAEMLRDAGAWELLDVDSVGEDGRAAARPHPDDAAYVIYTSGSTGRPKGCVVTHRNVVRLMVNDRFRFDFGPRDVWLAAHSFSFDFSVWEMYGALLYGGRLVVARRDEVRNPAALRALLRTHRVTVLNQTPAAFYALAEIERGEALHDLDTHLHTVIFGGDRLDPARLRTWTDIYPLERVRLVNMYGITETTVHVTYGPLDRTDLASATAHSPIGVPLPETRVYVCDGAMNLQPIGVPGEIYVGGSGVCRGYLNRPELTAARFIASPFRDGETLYRSGDLARWRTDGRLEYLGRNDDQVQIRGFRIELGEVQRVLTAHPAVRAAVVIAWQPSGDDDRRLVAYVVLDRDTPAEELRALARTRLPEAMVPAHIVPIDAVPLTANGKVDTRALPPPIAAAAEETRGDVQRTVAEVWRDVLHVEPRLDDNFFEIGGHSLLLVQVEQKLRERLGAAIPLVDLFRFPTIRTLAAHLRAVPNDAVPCAIAFPEGAAKRAIAVIGMAGHFPGARNIEELWRNLCDGVESSVELTDAQLRAAGVEARLQDDPRYVRRKPVLDGIDQFDPELFGISAREAELMDPQHRLFLECAWEALENAGYEARRPAGRVGVYGGVSFGSYLLNNLASHRDLLDTIGAYPVLIGNDRDFVATRVSYKLDLKGPSVNVSTACSTSLVAVHLACRALAEHEADMALAGAASIKVPQHEGYLYEEGGILSPDGHCRAFDAGANGTVGGSGGGVVVLKRLADAQRDGDNILAVIKGSAIGNDGAEKVGYTAPSVAGQAAVIAEAQARAGVAPETIGYVETHGTGTVLGDPIEIAALTDVFRACTARRRFCAIGSVKTNIGHLDAAAGMAGMIKTILALDRQRIPPSLNFSRPNPKIDFDEGPFYVAVEAIAWPRGDAPRRAGVSSFGLGGTNAHIVLEEAPAAPPPAPPARPMELLPLSAHTPQALDRTRAALAAHFEAHPDTTLADAAYTLAVGRRAFAHRGIAVCRDAAGVAASLRRAVTGVCRAAPASVTFLFPGGGAQHTAMAAELYAAEPLFREAFDRYAPAGTASPQTPEDLARPSIALPLLFATEYALAQLWMSWGVRPEAMLGHSAGEYAAACLAGVFTVDDARALVAFRGRLFETLDDGEMLSVPLGEDELRPLLGTRLSIAAVNHVEACVVSGAREDVDALAATLAARQVDSRKLRFAVAAHSALVEPILDEFRRYVSAVPMRAPRIPYLSNVTGTWITAQQATDPEYWVSHLRRTVRFADAAGELLRNGDRILLEVGPGNTLSSLAQRHPSYGGQPILQSLRHPADTATSDHAILLGALGRLWIEGVDVDWPAVYGGQSRRRVALPSAPFERRRMWIEPKAVVPTAVAERSSDVRDWLYVPSWRRTAEPPAAPPRRERWLLFTDEGVAGNALEAELRRREQHVVSAGSEATRDEHRCERLIERLAVASGLPDRIVLLDATFNGLLHLARAWKLRAGDHAVRIAAVTAGAQDVTGDEEPCPEQAMLFGPLKVITQECPAIRCCSIDLPPQAGTEALCTELFAANDDLFVARRGAYRWITAYERLRLPAADPPLRERGVYLITGGTGGVGRLLARALARSHGARVALVSRNASRGAEDDDVLLIDADVADVATIEGAVRRTIDHFGALHGVIHAAGITDGPSIFTPFEELTLGDCALQFRPKVAGTRALVGALDGLPLDFVLLISSNASVLGGLGLAAYAAANHFLDAFAAVQCRRTSVPWISANWDAWPTARRLAAGPAAGTTDRFAMSEAECEEAFRLVIRCRGQVVVSAGDLDARLARWTRLEEETPPTATVDLPSDDGAGIAAPRGDLQTALHALWLEMLGVPRIGVHDNFFELRGDSLLGTRIVTRVNRDFGVRLPLRALFEEPTIAGLAARIEALI
jgi:amino acid adenylation domain-containing protein